MLSSRARAMAAASPMPDAGVTAWAWLGAVLQAVSRAPTAIIPATRREPGNIISSQSPGCGRAEPEGTGGTLDGSTLPGRCKRGAIRGWGGWWFRWERTAGRLDGAAAANLATRGHCEPPAGRRSNLAARPRYPSGT